MNLVKNGYHRQLVLKEAFCAPWNWYTCTEIYRRYGFNIHI
jgi:hypothetical protein